MIWRLFFKLLLRGRNKYIRFAVIKNKDYILCIEEFQLLSTELKKWESILKEKEIQDAQN